MRKKGIARWPIRLPLTPREWIIMDVVWRRRLACAAHVHKQVHPRTEWAYSTVQTMLRRLVFKRSLEVESKAQAAFYRPAISRDLAREEAVQALCDLAFEGSSAKLSEWLDIRRARNDLARQRGSGILSGQGNP